MTLLVTLCPDCPIGREARSLIVSSDVLPGLLGALAPVIVATALAMLLVVWLERRVPGSRP
jgi:hypothetical protein